MDKILQEIANERYKQVDRFGLLGDDSYIRNELTWAAIAYLKDVQGEPEFAEELWPWSADSFKPGTPRRSLIKAAALIIAEIERMEREEEEKVEITASNRQM